MTPMLRKVEEAVCGTNGGRSPKLAAYYAHWERAIFHALTALVLNSMRSMTAMLSNPTPNAEEIARPSPLFKVTPHTT
jgi:dynein heavy chain